ncbi:Lipase class 3-like [Rhynchospora pubera]|uniref:Lipase class 3-like n=2 Tax=Rhynchospora pubera TaxID=906938 RepID=A0AAV8HB31_9POAL|nr:Lipase class 3-like [Rhynchospora pubera]
MPQHIPLSSLSASPSSTMLSLRSRVETWIRDQTARVEATWQNPVLPGLPTWSGWQWQWPPWKGREEEKRRIREELELRRKQLQELCRAVKAESLADLQEVLCSMVLAECVYKRPSSEMLKYINKFKSDFGGQVVSLERVQPSLDHVPHRYLLAEAGDTLFASFIGTKQYRDLMADINILQGAVFNEANEDPDMVEINEREEESPTNLPQGKLKWPKKSRPAAHKGFLARAKGIPALELYNLAQRKNRKLVLCGHSLGGAVAVLATLAILRIVASSSQSKESNGKIQVKCITFSQPPVGNEALRDYVHEKGWQSYFKTYCMPEDLVPRILSPAYFHHYNNTQSAEPKLEGNKKSANSIKQTENGTEPQLVLGLGPVQTSFWRLSKLVPIEAVTRNLRTFWGKSQDAKVLHDTTDDETVEVGQSLEICERPDGISLTPIPDKGDQKANSNAAEASKPWGRVPSLPSYVPFGELYLLGDLSVKSLSDAEYTKLTSVGSVITELKDFLRSHSMRSYRSRFQKIYDSCMCSNISPFVGMDQLPQFSHLQQLLGLSTVETVELGNIVEPPIIRTATTVVPLGWNGEPGQKSSDPLKVDIMGHGLHLCTLVQAYLNGNWCSTAVESVPLEPPYSSNQENTAPELQKMRILVGPPLKKPPKYPITEESLLPIYVPPLSDSIAPDLMSLFEGRRGSADGLEGFVIYCTSDFVTVRKEVHVRARRVLLLGLEGAGKTSLFRALLGHVGEKNYAAVDSYANADTREGMAGGLYYVDCPSINLQNLKSETTWFREELQSGSHHLGKKTDLIILVHNLSHRIPNYPILSSPSLPPPQPALSLFLNEAKALSIPWIMAITNKFSVSTHQQNRLISFAMEAYEASPSVTRVVNSCPFFMPNGPLRPFGRKEAVMPVEGVNSLREVVHGVLREMEETTLQELADGRLAIELSREKDNSLSMQQKPPKHDNSITAAAVGASLGAGLGVVMAIVMGAASALRKP